MFPGLKPIELLSASPCGWYGNLLESVIIRKALSRTLLGNVCVEYDVPCTLKTSFVDFEKEMHVVAATQILNLSSLPNSLYLFQLQSKVVFSRLTHPSTHFYTVLYVIELDPVLNITEVLLAGRQVMINQSILIFNINYRFQLVFVCKLLIFRKLAKRRRLARFRKILCLF